MDEQRITLTLRPVSGGRTTLKAFGTVPSERALPELRLLLSLLARWNGEPISIVLCVGGASASGCDRWTDALSAADPSDFEVRFEIIPDEGPPECP